MLIGRGGQREAYALPPLKLWGEIVLSRPADYRNRLLAQLTPADLDRIEPHLTHISLPQRTQLVTPNVRIERCFFLESGVASVVASSADGKQTEVGIIGREGMVDVSTVMGKAISPLQIFIQIPGEGYAIRTSEVVAMTEKSPDFMRLVLGFAHSFLIQISYTALATATLSIENRLCRWLLMSFDRSESSSIPMTHEFLSLMLGVRRAGVTDALNSLVGAGLIVTSRGHITIVNRKGLEERAMDNYGIPEANYRALVEG